MERQPDTAGEERDFADGPQRDPRLEIPEILQRPVDHPSKRPKQPSTVANSMGELGTALAIGLDFLFTAIAGGVVGYVIDRWLGSSPTGLLIGLSVGFIAGTARLIKRLNAQDGPPTRTRAGAGSGGDSRGPKSDGGR